jgi:hypothetical protein
LEDDHDDDASWTQQLDLERFEELADHFGQHDVNWQLSALFVIADVVVCSEYTFGSTNF